MGKPFLPVVMLAIAQCMGALEGAAGWRRLPGGCKQVCLPTSHLFSCCEGDMFRFANPLRCDWLHIQPVMLPVCYKFQDLELAVWVGTRLIGDQQAVLTVTGTGILAPSKLQLNAPKKLETMTAYQCNSLAGSMLPCYQRQLIQYRLVLLELLYNKGLSSAAKKQAAGLWDSSPSA